MTIATETRRVLARHPGAHMTSNAVAAIIGTNYMGAKKALADLEEAGEVDVVYVIAEQHVNGYRRCKAYKLKEEA